MDTNTIIKAANSTIIASALVVGASAIYAAYASKKLAASIAETERLIAENTPEQIVARHFRLV